MGAGLTITQAEPACTSGAAVTTPTGGAFAAGDYSVCVVPVYHPAGVFSDKDFLGASRTSIAAWNGIVVADNDQIVVPFTPPTLGTALEPEYPRRYLLLTQGPGATTFDYTAVASAEGSTTNPFATTITADGSSGVGSVTLGAAANSVVFSHVLDLQNLETNSKVYETYSGQLRRKSLISRKAIRRLLIVVPGGACTHSAFSRLLKWMSAPIRCTITESETGGAEADAPIVRYTGFFVHSPYLNSIPKNRSTEYQLEFLVESTTASAQVP